MNKIFRQCIAVITATTLWGGSADAAGYTLTDLGTLGGYESVGYGINEQGQVTGYSTVAGFAQVQAFLYDGSLMIGLGTVSNAESIGRSINDTGEVVGYDYTVSTNDAHAIHFDGSALLDLGTLAGKLSFAWDINEQGQIVGYSQLADDFTNHAFRYEDGMFLDLGTLGGDYSIGLAINEAGHTTGYSRIPDNTAVHAFLHDGSTMNDIGTLGGASLGQDINDADHITGYSYTDATNNYPRAFLYDGTTLQNLGTLGGDYSYGFAINNQDHVVGYSYTTDNLAVNAFLHDGTGMQDLCALTDCITAGWDELTAAYDINDNGDITGVGRIAGEYHAFLICNGPKTSTGCGVPDSDEDGVPDDVDNCPVDANPGQQDSDYDDQGDACDAVFDNDSAGEAAEEITATIVDEIEAIPSLSGSSGMISKLTGNSGVMTLVDAAIADYELGNITLTEYLAELDSALGKLDAFDNQLAGKIHNGSIIDPEASLLLEASATIREIIEALITNA